MMVGKLELMNLNVLDASVMEKGKRDKYNNGCSICNKDLKAIHLTFKDNLTNYHVYICEDCIKKVGYKR